MANVTGTNNNDTITPGATSGGVTGTPGNGDDTIDGLGGNDVIDGGGGADTINAGSGNDTILLGGLDENEVGTTVDGGNNTDRIVLESDITVDDFDPISVEEIDTQGFEINGTNSGGGDGGANTIDLSGITNVGDEDVIINGLGGNDTITGTNQNDTINGGAGSDTINGGGGADTIDGGSGDDTINGGSGNDIIDGGSGADTIDAGSGNDTITLGGTDENEVGTTVHGGNNTDKIVLASNITVDDFDPTSVEEIDTQGNAINGTNSGGGDGGANTIDLSGITNVGASKVVINGQGGGDTLTGTDQADEINGGAGEDTINGGGGADMIDGGSGDDTINGGSGNDDIDGGSGADTIDAGSGNDTIRLGGLGEEDERGTTVHGGNNTDKIVLESNITVDDFDPTSVEQIDTNGFAINGTNSGGGDGGANTIDLSGVTRIDVDPVVINGLGGNDTLTGTDQADVINGGAGEDTINGGGGADIIDGGSGDDTINGGSGNDEIDGGSGADTIDAGSGNDTITLGGADSDERGTTVHGGNNTDKIVLASDITVDDFDPTSVEQIDTNGFAINGTNSGGGDGGANTIDLSGVTNVGAEDVIINGLGGNDTLTGTNQDDVINGGAGSDTIIGAGGADDIDGGSGDDTINGGSGNDNIDGGSGADTIDAGSGNDTITLGGADSDERGTTVHGGNNTDKIVLASDITVDDFDPTSVEQIDTNGFAINGTNSGGGDGGANNINLSGITNVGSSPVKINGLGGNDSLIGSNSDDIINGGAGNDDINGGSGKDTADFLGGGAVTVNLDNGNDGTATGQGNDTLTDIENVSGSDFADTINITGNKANVVTGNGGADVINTGGGNDTVNGGAGDIADGGSGTDTLNLSLTLEELVEVIGGGEIDELFEYVESDGASGPLDLDQSIGNQATGFEIVNLDIDGIDNFIFGTNGNDVQGAGDYTLFPSGVPTDNTPQDDLIFGLDGDDVIEGGNGNDILVGGAGADTLRGESGNDTFVLGGAGAENEQGTTVDGGNNTDKIVLASDITVDDFDPVNVEQIDTNGFEINGTNSGGGDGGANTIDLSGVTRIDADPVVINGLGGNDTITGTSQADVINGGSGADTLNGGNGNDDIDGGSGNDTINGGSGNDTIDGGSGADTIDAGSGNDTITLGGAEQNEIGTTVDGGNNTDKIVLASDITVDDFDPVNVEQIDTNGFAINGTNSGGGDGGANTIDLSGVTRIDADPVVINGLGGNDTITGTSQADVINGGSGADTLNGGNGNDDIDGGSGNDTINGGSGNDTIDGGSGADTIDAGSGNDTITLGGAEQNEIGTTVDGGNNTDKIVLASDITVDDFDPTNVEQIDTGVAGFAINGTDSGGGDGGANTIDLSGVSNVGTEDVVINGLGGNDTITGTAQADVISGGSGEDTLNGGDGNDDIDGGSGNDTINGGSGNDTIDGGSGTDTIDAGSGNDTITLGGTGEEDEQGTTVDGGNNTDKIVLASDITVDDFDPVNVEQIDTQGFAINGTNSGGGDGGTNIIDLSGVANVGGSPVEINGLGGDDTITGTAQADVINGGDGEDTLNGGNGNDTIDGGSGNDTINGDSGNDTIDGGSGADTIDAGSGNDTITLGGADTDEQGTTVDGGNNTDKIVLASDITVDDFDPVNVEQIDTGVAGFAINGTNSGGGDGGANTIDLSGVTNVGTEDVVINGFGGDDTITGTAQSDTINGGSGEDTLNGGNGNDDIDGGSGDDTIDGGSGADTIDGGSGADTIDAGSGNDTITLGGTGAEDEQGTTVDGGNNTDKIVLASNITVDDFDPANVEQIDTDGFAINGTNSGGGDGGANTIDLSGITNVGGSDVVINGLGGNDTLTGSNSDDVINGGSGEDTISGGGGADMLNGGSGDDTLTGDAGNDTFVFNVGDDDDTITDFSGNDEVDASGHGFDEAAFNALAATAGDAGKLQGGESNGGVTVTDTGDDLVIDFGGGDTLTFVGVDELDSGDFAF